jgi:hypothetical protein
MQFLSKISFYSELKIFESFGFYAAKKMYNGFASKQKRIVAQEGYCAKNGFHSVFVTDLILKRSSWIWLQMKFLRCIRLSRHFGG